MTDDQKKKYEEAAKAWLDTEGERLYNEGLLPRELCNHSWIAGATHAHNEAIDAALTAMRIEWREDRHAIYNAIEKLKL